MAVTASDLAGRLSVSEEVAARLLAVASDQVGSVRLVDDVPDSATDEAIVRCAAWLRDRGPDSAGLALAEVGGDVEVRFLPGFGPLRHSGALAVLKPWTIRGAGLCEAAE